MQHNDQQKQAIALKNGPALIIAGAGTGKTSVIIERILHLIASGVPPEKILALTFTEKAASEMIERISLQSTQSLFSLPIYTFNGFGASLLDEFAVDIGLASPMRLLGETGQLVFMRDHLDDFNLDYFSPVSRPDSQLSNLRSYFSKLKQQLIWPKAYMSYVAAMPTDDQAQNLEKQKHTELAHAYKTYLDLCRREHVIDYDDQIFLTLELLQKRPNIQRTINERFSYIVVDEFQDTNPMQSALLDAIVNADQNIMAVGDDDQSIYGWRGATLDNILSFSERYTNVKNIVLQDNYRSSQAILDAAYSLIQHNNPHRLEHTTGLNKKLISHKAPGAKPTVRHFLHQQNELQWIADDIQQKIASGHNAGSIAVLARRNSDVALLHEILAYTNVPHVVIGTSTSVFDTLAVKQLVQLLTAVLNPQDNTAVYNAFSSAAFAIEPVTLAKAAHLAKTTNQDLYDVLQQTQDDELQKSLAMFATWVAQQHTATVGDIAYSIISESGWTDRLYTKAQTHDASATELQGLGLFFELLRDFTKTSSHPTLAMFIESLPLLKSSIADIKDDTERISLDLVNVMSIHKSKGLEWDTVYIFNCNEGSMPLSARNSSLSVPTELLQHTEADDHIAEERRLMYVALTRAAKEVVITYSDTKTGNRTTKPSRFISEIGDKNILLAHDASAPQSDLTMPSLQLVAPISLPEDILQGDLLVLSVSQVATWLQCPQEFYYLHVLKTPQKPDPSRGYGTLIHACIERMHTARLKNTPLSFEEIQAFYNESWPKAGYMSANHRDRALQQGSHTLRRIYDRFSSDQEPTPIKTEFSFRVPIPNTNVILKGRIDAVYDTEAGTVIVDYKTGNGITSPEKAKQRATSSQQLTMYALAWQLMNNALPAQLQLDFVETGFVGSVSKKQQSITTITTKIVTMADMLASGSYPAGDHTFCTHP